MAEERKSAEVGGKSAGYLFEFKPDGVYFTVYPTEDSEMLFELSDMRQILKEYGVTDYDMGELARAVRAADGTPCKLANHFEASVSPPSNRTEESASAEVVDNREVMSYQIEVAKDRMTVTLKINRQPGQRPPTKEEILKELSGRRIVFGIDEEAIERGLEHGTQTVIAKGKPPEAGRDAKIIRKFNAEQKGKIAEDKYGRVDYKNLNLFLLARKGDVLAERVPHTMGVEGTNVFGDTIKPKPGKPKPVPAGKNTEIQDENFVVATIDGQIVEANNKFSVDPRLEIKGDIGVGTGNIDFIGIGGIGMSGIAQIMIKKGYKVSGSDLKKSNLTENLEAIGAKIYYNHNESNIDGADTVVYSTAISENNIEVQAAQKAGIQIIKRAEMLGFLMNGKNGTAVAGTHGKTTTSSMISYVFKHIGLNPTVIIGGELSAITSNASSGTDPYVIAEADESDASFLYLAPKIAVITSIDSDVNLNVDRKSVV